MFAQLIINWTIFRICLAERLVYRIDFALGTLMRFLPIVTQIFLWYAVYEAISSKEVAGYSYRQMVAYFLLTMVSRAFSSMPGLASGVAGQIRTGEIKKFLIQPIDMIQFMLISRMAHKAAYYSVAIFPFALVFFLCRDYFDGWPAAEIVAGFVLSLILSFLLGFFLEMSIGLIGFWWLNISSLMFIYMLLNFFLSGHMFPLDMLPAPWDTIVDLLPLKYLAFFPSAVFLGKVQGQDLIEGLLIELAWVVFFILLSRVMYRYGTRRYSAFGG